MDPEILAYYERGDEDGRLRSERLEFLRTQDILRRTLPKPPARVLDVGGASGVHAEWLIADGYQVELIDPVPLHLEQARRIPGLAVREGDARSLPAPTAGADVALLLGPLYHLLDRADRVRALAEARRAVRPGGLVVAATISRYAALHDMLHRDRYGDARIRGIVDRSVVDGVLRATYDMGFTTAYLHDPDEIPAEFADAGLPGAERYGIEGAAAWFGDVTDLGLLLDALRTVERVPTLLGVSAHLLTVARTAG